MRPTHTIEDLLGSRSRIAVLRLLLGVDVPLNASQIAARTGLTRPAVASVLANLSAIGAIRSSPAGRATIHWLNRDSVYVENLVGPIFEAEQRLPEDMLDDLAGAFHDGTVSVILFGSYARGEQTPASDVDVALVTADGAAAAAVESAAADHATAFRDKFGASLSYLIYTIDEARSLSSASPGFLESIKRDGILVSGLNPWEWGADVQE
ncbi:MAG: nucleotidyltransferase domain-containing protein [Coriobacteriia bacterium]